MVHVGFAGRDVGLRFAISLTGLGMEGRDLSGSGGVASLHPRLLTLSPSGCKAGWAGVQVYLEDLLQSRLLTGSP